MTEIKNQTVIKEFQRYVEAKTYPCVAARAAMAREQVTCMVAGHMACPNDDPAILQFLYHFVQGFRGATTPFHSAAIIFKEPVIETEEIFDKLFWQRLQGLVQLDAENFTYDKRVNPDPSSVNFSFSLAEEAFFIIGLHPSSNRASRRFIYPVIVFNPHEQFEQLRKSGRYENMKNIVRLRDIAYSGSINPMLSDFGHASEVYQYTGRKYEAGWKCPLKINHGEIKHNTSQE